MEMEIAKDFRDRYQHLLDVIAGKVMYLANVHREKQMIERLSAAEGPLYCDVCGSTLQRESCNHVVPCETCLRNAVTLG